MLYGGKRERIGAVADGRGRGTGAGRVEVIPPVERGGDEDGHACWALELESTGALALQGPVDHCCKQCASSAR